MAAPTTPTNNRLLVTKPREMDPNTDRGFRETERFVNTHPGLPVGGTTGQVLEKNSAANYDVSWQTPSGGGGGTDPPPHGACVISGPTITFTPGFLSFVTLPVSGSTTQWDSGGVVNTANNSLDALVSGQYFITADISIINNNTAAWEYFVNFAPRSYQATVTYPPAGGGVSTAHTWNVQSLFDVTTTPVHIQVQVAMDGAAGGASTCTANIARFAITRIGASI